ncbi:P-loop containing nucleoside triphosphate hydrolase protein [Auricularia subglabra TFB-10046 SS5]|nr:P-loop containing nucleoside triphosphate hydrolase protein [Auricularia subglabra TFB-10046 SS5]
MKNAWKWTDKEPHDFQVEAGRAQCRGRDVLIHARTGLGKTAVVAAPYAFAQNAKRKTIFVSPLIALQEEMIETFRDDYGLSAIAIHSGMDRPLREVVKASQVSKNREICEGDHNIILISPEMLQSRLFIGDALRNPKFARRVLSVGVDEAHCVSHWGAEFRKKYGSLGIVRAFLPKHTSVVAMSATFTPRVRRDVLSKLHFGDDYINLDMGNNRSNVSLVARAMHHTQATFNDIDFVIPRNLQHADEIPQTFVYIDDTKIGNAIIDHLVDLLPASLRDEGLIRPFNATHSHQYRKNAMDHFRNGSIRVLVCTDAAGMGCNLPNIEVVVQWGLPDKLSTWIQRAGRAARRPGLKGLAVLLVEPTAYGVYPDASLAPEGGRKGVKSKPKRPPAGWAAEHGRKRGASSTTDNTIDRTIAIPVDEESPDEGLLAFVQTGDCRRRVVADAFKCRDKSTDAGVACCDLCDPELFKQVLPGRGGRAKAKTSKSKPNAEVTHACQAWREKIYESDWAGSMFAASGILGDGLVEKIASSQVVHSERDLKVLIASEWQWWDDYGKSLYNHLADANCLSSRLPPNRGLHVQRRDPTDFGTARMIKDASTYGFAIAMAAKDMSQSHILGEAF